MMFVKNEMKMENRLSGEKNPQTFFTKRILRILKKNVKNSNETQKRAMPY